MVQQHIDTSVALRKMCRKMLTMDGRVYIRCNVCGERIAIYRFRPSDVNTSKNLNDDFSILVTWLEKHADCRHETKDWYRASLPDLEFIVD